MEQELTPEQQAECDRQLEQYIQLMKRMYTRMEKENSWPWEIDPEGWNEEHKVQAQRPCADTNVSDIQGSLF